MAKGRGGGGRRKPSSGSSSKGQKSRAVGGRSRSGPSERTSSAPRKAAAQPAPRKRTGGGVARPDVVAGSAGEGRRRSGPGGDRIEGRQAVRELLLADRRKVLEVVMQSGLDEAAILEDIQMLADDRRITIREVGRSSFDGLTDTESAQGVYAEAEPLPTVEIEDMISEPNPFLVMVDGLTDPHNLGAIFRSADAAGVTGIILPKHRSARISATVAKTAAGAIEHVPIASVAGVPTAIALLQKHDVWVIGLDEGGTRSIFDLDLADQPMCLVLGAEGPGLSRLTRERCDELVSIPMQGAVASLNVSAAATVAMFDVARRRLGL